MIFTLDHIVDSLAGVLVSQYPEYPVYDSPNPRERSHLLFYFLHAFYRRRGRWVESSCVTGCGHCVCAGT